MRPILITGFQPFSPLTRLRGNPSGTVAVRLGEMFGNGAQVAILPVDATCLSRVDALLQRNPAGVIMLGGAMQVADCVLEVEGAETSHGLLTTRRRRSSFAAAAAEHCRSIGMKLGTAPPAPLVYWCLRSYARALAWSEPRKVPCAFVHLSYVPVLGDVSAQVKMTAALFRHMQATFA